MTNFTNSLTNWLAFEVVKEKNFKKRAKILGRIIKLGKHLIELKNFNSLMSVYLCLNLNCITRLKQTWKALPRKLKPILKNLEMLNPYNNFTGYRLHIKDVRPPFVPCVGKKPFFFQQQKTFLRSFFFFFNFSSRGLVKRSFISE